MVNLKLKKKIKKKIFKHLTGKKSLQNLFKRLHELSLAGMNFGGGENVQSSGEKNVICYLAEHLDENAKPVVFDIGANAGSYAMEVMNVFKNSVDIYCFEPMKETFTILSKNMQSHDNVKVNNFGFADKDGVVTIYSDKKDSCLASAFQRRMEHLGVSAQYKEEVAIKTLDGFCKENGIKNIDLVKIDVEGGELSVLKGAKSLIDTNSIGMIQFEFGGFNIASRTFFQDFFFLLNPNFRIYRILKDGLEPVDEYKEAHEIFLTTNYLAVSRKRSASSK